MAIPQPDHVDQWINRQISPLTKSTYRRTITEWSDWLDCDLTEATSDHGNRWRDHLIKLGQRERTVCRKLASVASFYRFMATHQPTPLIERSPFGDDQVRRPKVKRGKGVTKALTEAEAARLEDVTASSSPAAAIAISVLLASAIRADEVLTLRLENITVEAERVVIAVDRKGGDRERIPLPARVAASVNLIRKDRRRGYLLANAAGGPWTYWQLHRAVEAAGNAAGLEKVTPHVLRTTWATIAIANGRSLAAVQDVMGHASPETTRSYDRRQDDMANKVAAVDAVAAAIEKHRRTPSPTTSPKD